MNHHTFLIKEAVTTGALAAIAKQHKIPMIGDWRYASKLLHKAQKATPAGARHYGEVLGFTTPTERRTLDRLLSRGQRSEEEAMKLLHRYYPNTSMINPTLEGQKQVIGSTLKSKIGRSLLEGGIYQKPGGTRKIAPGIPGGTLFPEPDSMTKLSPDERQSFMIEVATGMRSMPPPGFQRSIHIHPPLAQLKKKVSDEFLGPHREGRFGSVTPSSPLDLGELPSERLANSLLKAHEAHARGDPKAWDKLMSEGLDKMTMSMVEVPKDLDAAVNLLKRYTQKGYLKPVSDTTLLSEPVMSTHAIYSPTAKAEGVMKGSRNALRRMYYRGLD